MAERITPVFCDATFEELRSRLMRRKFDRYVGRASREFHIGRVAAVAEWVLTSGEPMGCRDPDDDKFLETAIEGRADCLITGDRDLLEMSPFRDISIFSPADFLAMRRERAPPD